MSHPFDEVTKALPEADIPLPEAQAWILQGTNHQVLFAKCLGDVVAPEHSHGKEWGIVLEGETELTIEGETKVYRKGDAFFIPAGVKHSARARAGSFVVQFFDQPDRFKARK